MNLKHRAAAGRPAGVTLSPEPPATTTTVAQPHRLLLHWHGSQRAVPPRWDLRMRMSKRVKTGLVAVAAGLIPVAGLAIVTAPPASAAPGVLSYVASATATSGSSDPPGGGPDHRATG